MLRLTGASDRGSHEHKTACLRRVFAARPFSAMWACARLPRTQRDERVVKYGTRTSDAPPCTYSPAAQPGRIHAPRGIALCAEASEYACKYTWKQQF